MSTTSATHPARRNGSARDIHQSRSGPLAALSHKLHLWLKRTRQRDALLARVDDKRFLDDVGLTRQQVLHAANKPFSAERTAFLRAGAMPYSSGEN
jgi:uncharacterized protein YjiS (DUF1127 family)